MPEMMYNSEQGITYDAIKIGLASPEKIREWSKGEVRKPGLLTTELKPERRFVLRRILVQ